MILSVTAVMICMILGYSILSLLALKFILKRFSVNVPFIVFSFILIGLGLFQQIQQGRVIPSTNFILILIAGFALRMIFAKKSKKVN
ncbi:hypothetical protein YDYSG_37840 [Paenibacillus tyrfis]|nr:hypothetical protein QJ48_07595 [Paenibacillus sp. A3]GLI07754.1 hypothetical protein YDYSG_37840 [Paenibacillus tyrfis]